MSQRAHITGVVQYREGDGANVTIPLGPCEVHQTAQDATISWTDGESPASAAIPIADFRRHVASHAIRLDAAQAA